MRWEEWNPGTSCREAPMQTTSTPFLPGFFFFLFSNDFHHVHNWENTVIKIIPRVLTGTLRELQRTSPKESHRNWEQWCWRMKEAFPGQRDGRYSCHAHTYVYKKVCIKALGEVYIPEVSLAPSTHANTALNKSCQSL